MTVSSKKVISAVNSKSGEFSHKEIVTALTQTDTGNRRKKKAARKAALAPKEIAIIDEVLQGLAAGGFVKKKRNIFVKVHPLTVEGKIRMNTKGIGTLYTLNDDEILIEKEDTASSHDNDIVSVRITDFRRGIFHGFVQKIIQRGRETYFAKITHRSRDEIIFTLLDSRGGQELICERTDEEPGENDIAMLKLEPGELKNRQRCSIISFFSPDDDRHDFTRIVMKHSLPAPHPDYPELAGIETKSLDRGPRRDFTGQFTVTIDGESAKDFDDAVSVEKRADGYVLHVHIADVSAYLGKNTDLDLEAQSRGNSYYLGNNVIPMLPEVLSNDLCSLREGVDRLCMTAVIHYDFNGAVRDCSFTRGIIRVKHRLSYNSTDEILSRRENTPLFRLLENMYELAMILFRRRLGEGSLDLNLTDETLIYENNVVTDIQFSTRLRSHRIIEEFMLAANVVVSRTLRENRIPTLYRNHESVTPDSLVTLKNFLKLLNIQLRTTGPAGLNIQKVLQQVSGKDIEHVVNLVILKSLMQAYYGISPEGHFGLGFRDYAHFTSPIRRYPDLVVHRCLKTYLDGAKPPYSPDDLVMIGDRSSEMERVAQSAERDFKKIKACRLMRDRVGEVFPAMVSGVSKYGVYVSLAHMPIDGMIPLRTLTDDFYLLREDEYTVIGRRHGRRFRIGDRLTVKLSAVEIERMIMDFALA